MKIVKQLFVLGAVDASGAKWVERVQLDTYEEEELDFEFMGSQYKLVTGHSCSHYGQPVVVDQHWEAVGEGDILEIGGRLVLGFELYDAAVKAARRALAEEG